MFKFNHMELWIPKRCSNITRQYGSTILITENSFALIESLIRDGDFGHLQLTELESVKVKGKEQEVKILGLKDTVE